MPCRHSWRHVPLPKTAFESSVAQGSKRPAAFCRPRDSLRPSQLGSRFTAHRHGPRRRTTHTSGVRNIIVLHALRCKNTLIALQIATIRLQILGQTKRLQSLRRTKRVACQWNTRPVKCSCLNPCERSHKNLERRASRGPDRAGRDCVNARISHARLPSYRNLPGLPQSTALGLARYPLHVNLFSPR